MSHETLLDLARSVALAVSFRALPFVAYVILTRRTSAADKLACALLYVGASTFFLGSAGDAVTHLTDVATTYGAWLVLLVGVIAASRTAPTNSWIRVPAAVLAFLAWMAVPVLLSRTGLAVALVLVAVDGGMSAASLVLAGDRLAARDAVFFVLVDPSLSLRTRARPVARPRLDGAHAARWMRGVATLALGTFLAASPVLLVTASSQGADGSAAFVRFAVATVLLCVQIYTTHVGLADLQIGSMRMLGFDVPERYVAPFSAVGPRDFWCRWNTYVNSWMRDHVYAPIVRSGAPVLGRERANDAAILMTFVTSGCLHVASARVIRGTFDPSLFAFFVAQGVAMIGWATFDRFVGARSPKAAPSPTIALVSRLSFFGLQAVAMGIVFGAGGLR